ncbi:MAG: pyrroloquinoline quinone biosynthesis protein PqqE [Myxococcota bacterium]
MATERLVLSRHAALKARRQGDVLVLPERAIRLGGSGGEILRLLDRPRSADEVVAALERRYAGSAGVAEETRAFLAQMRRVGAIEPAPGASRAHPAVDRGASAGIARTSVPAAASTAPSPPTSASAPAPLIQADTNAGAPAPLNLIAELTYRCPLQCPYCSNPIGFRARREALDAKTWGRVFDEAADLGVVHLGLTGGEPSTRSDLEGILSAAVEADLYPHLVTAARPLTRARLDELAGRGLRSVQVSLQAVDAELSARLAGTACLEDKLAIARRTVELGLSLTLNCVLHRHNLDQVARLIDLAIELGADRLELANTQYHNWALRNRAALMPTRAQLDAASDAVQAARSRAEASGLTMLFVRPDYHAGRPKPCMGGWGRLAMVVDPTGLVLPCHEAADLPGLDFWRVPERRLAEAWRDAPGMNAYRGTAWMPEPCRGCPDKERDFGGCRCQAFRLLGDAGRTDPACDRSPEHDVVVRGRAEVGDAWVYRR